MERSLRFIHSVPGVALLTVLLLLVPLVAMQFTEEVRWGVGDFFIMGVLIFGSGLFYVLITRRMPNFINRIAMGSAVGSTFLLVWVNLAVGLIGGGPNPGNLMYIGVVWVIIIGTYLSRFTPKGMERTMFAASGSIVLIAIIALVAGMQYYPGSSVGEILGVNAFFATLFAVSGLLFRYVALISQQSDSKSAA